MQFTWLGASDDLDDIGTEGRADFDLEPALMRAGNVDGFIGGDERVAGEAVGEKNNGGAIALMTENSNVALLSSAHAEADGFTLGISSFAVGGEDFHLEIFGKLSQSALGDVLHVGQALLNVLWFDRPGELFACRLIRIGPDLGFDFIRRNGEAGFFDLAAFEPG